PTGAAAPEHALTEKSGQCYPGWLGAIKRLANTSFQNNSGPPKDFRPPVWQAELPENRAHRSVGGLIAHRGGSPHVRPKAPRVHQACRRRGGRVAARGARANRNACEHGVCFSDDRCPLPKNCGEEVSAEYAGHIDDAGRLSAAPG